MKSIARQLLPFVLVLLVYAAWDSISTIEGQKKLVASTMMGIGGGGIPQWEQSAEVAQASSTLSPIFSPSVRRWEPLITQYAAQYGIPPNLVATVMQIESCGDPYAESHAGAQGLFQVMPFHFEAHESMKDPATNANRGMAYLAQGLQITGGDWGRAMAGYNGGHSIANKDWSHWSNETQRYYHWGTGIYADAVARKDHSARLQEWLQAGGSSLCAQAASRDISSLGY